MKSLYGQFMLVVFGFLIFSLCIHFWAFVSSSERFTLDKALSQNSIRNLIEMTKNSTEMTARKSTIIFNITSKSGLLVKNPKPVGIWNTESGSDRILEQMAHVPGTLPLKDVARKPKIIFVDDYGGGFGVYSGNKTFKQHECRVQNCEVVKHLYKSQKIAIDALLIGGTCYQDMVRALSNYSMPDVIWIQFRLESPYAPPYCRHTHSSIFNWTATYRTDSTIVAPYGKWVAHQNTTVAKSAERNYAEGKRKMAAIFMSNCKSINRRLQYVDSLKNNVSVDIYGKCGNISCSRETPSKCFDMLSRDYKFYLAFENANCKDYITEKFFVNGLQNDVIPVVMGARKEEYEKVAPPNSFIHVDDFKSTEHLATYLHQLDQNDTLYNEYFKWKGTGGFLNTKFWCRLCALLNEDNKPELTVSFTEWYGAANSCTNGRWIKNETTVFASRNVF